MHKDIEAIWGTNIDGLSGGKAKPVLAVARDLRPRDLRPNGFMWSLWPNQWKISLIYISFDSLDSKEHFDI